MSAPEHLASRLSFMKFGTEAQSRIRDVMDVVTANLPVALDTLYDQIDKFPETKGLFPNKQQMEAARQRQLTHWRKIAGGVFDEAYVEAVSTIGRVHARIGLEPRWYIGGYALILEKLVEAVIEERWPKGVLGRSLPGAKERSAEVSSIVKAAMLDMDYAISMYIQAAETARLKAEQDAWAAEREKAEKREMAVSLVAEGMAALSRGDLTHRIPSDIPDEYAAIRDHFNEAMGHLGEMIVTMKTNSADIAGSSHEIQVGAENLSARTDEQACALQESAATSEQLAASVKASTEASRRTAALADEATSVARAGGSIVQDAIEAMARIEIASKKITEITAVIDGIAFQTNLLALNAAVEAARAGDAGRGFAVVASEVRALAQRSSAAAKDISELIKSSGSEVAVGVRLVREAGQALDQIVDSSLKVSTTVQEIADASGEQASGLDEMSRTVSHMDDMTQQNAALAEQSAAAASMLLGKVEQLNRLIVGFRTEDGSSVRPQTALRAA